MLVLLLLLLLIVTRAVSRFVCKVTLCRIFNLFYYRLVGLVVKASA